MVLILLGAIAMACFTVALFFIRFWKTTHDRFFLFFAIAFCIEGLDKILQGIIKHPDTQEPFFYLIRLLSYSIIIFAIIDKNWKKR